MQRLWFYIAGFLFYGFGCRHDWRDENGSRPSECPRMARWTCDKCREECHDWVW